VALVGSTASGKSSVAMAVAERLGDVELISIDSMQVYEGMDIGTAKPSAAERSLVRHHLLDLVPASDEFGVAQFQHSYAAALIDIKSRNNRALLVGGTGLYHRAVIDDLHLPGEWPEIRAGLREEAAAYGPERLHERLVELDPQAAERMRPTNTRRIVRALEVCVGSGRPFSEFGPGLETYAESSVVQIGLRWDRAVLTERIEDRVNSMIEAGLVEEVVGLVAAGMSRTARQALGYKELIEHLSGEVTLDQAIAQIVLRTRQFAVKQERWFRRDPRIRWVDIEIDPVPEAVPAVIEALECAR
jgi:tRNA dimethylallyltransferase